MNNNNNNNNMFTIHVDLVLFSHYKTTISLY